MGFDTPESSAEAEFDQVEMIEDEAAAERVNLSEKVNRKQAARILQATRDPRMIEYNINNRYGQLPGRINAAIARRKPSLDAIVPVLEGMNASEAVRSELLAIIESFEEPLEDASEGMTSRYVYIEKGRNGQPDWYRVNFQTVERDRAMLRDLAASYPPLREVLATIDAAITDVASQDDGFIFDQRRRSAPPNRVDGAVLEMGRLTGVVIGGALTLISAIAWGMGIKGQEKGKRNFLSGIWPVAIYGGITAILAKPDLMDRFFGAEYKGSMDAIRNGMEGRYGLKAMSAQFKIRGPEWRSTVENITENEAETKEIATLLRQGKATQENVQEYIQSVAPQDNRAHQGLLIMINAGAFPGFAENLLSVKDEDAREMMLDYIDQGASRFEQAAQADAAQMEAELEKAEEEQSN